MAERARILILIPHLGGGGAERVAVLLADSLKDEFEIHIGMAAQNSRSFKKIEQVKTYDLGSTRVRFSGFRILGLVRLVRPDLIVSGMYHLNLLVLFLKPWLRPRAKIIVRQNASPRAHTICRSRFLSRLLYQWLYPRADVVICQSPEMLAEMNFLCKTRVRCCVLPNPVDVQSIRSARGSSVSSSERLHLLAVGRLAHEKGFDLLLEALGQVQAQIPSIQLTILGTGSEEKGLRDLTIRLGLSKVVRFAGEVDRPDSWFFCADIFVLPSREDALPNALLEAAAAGLAIIATPASSALKRMLSGKSGVWLTADCTADSLAESIQTAFAHLDPRQRFDHAWITPFEMQNAIAAYAHLFRSIISGEPS